MPPLERRRRRRITRSSAVVVAVVVVVLLCLLLLVGGIAKTGTASYGYSSAVNRSYAAQASQVVGESNRLGHELASFVPGVGGETRTEVEATLDTLVRGTGGVARDAVTISSPAPSAGVGTAVADALGDTARAVAEIRTVVDRLVGMSPLGVPDSPDPSSSATSPRPISTAAARAALDGVVALLARADRTYARARRTLRAAPGHASLPRSEWATASSSITDRLGSMVAEIEASATLAPVRSVVLVDHALALTPAPVPPASGTAGVQAMLPPTTRLTVTAVVANDGNVAEHRVVVSAEVTPTGAGRPSLRQRTIALGPGDSDAVLLPALRVVPGRSYKVSVKVSSVGTAPPATTSDSIAVTVAPPSPPSVSGLTPGHGRRRGGTAVTIFGTGFVAVTGVRFGRAKATYRVVSANEIVAVAPRGSGTVAVTVSNPGGDSALSSADRFTYTASARATSKVRRVDRSRTWS
jgi:hypothetical protein